MLWVDDEPTTLRIMTQFLKQAGVGSVLPVTHAREALSILSNPKQRVDLAFCDILMPEIDGLELVQRLGTTLQFNGALAFVSAAQPELVETARTFSEAYGLRVLDMLPKPVTPAQLVAVLRALQEDLNPVPVTAPSTPPVGSSTLQ
ncbi:hypothetical protein MAIT1_00700 [Magnetofaba australis IT-1]|uniref:Response regulatory domain-containing protein n=1 Tax=Magnetofaba australis IT-1 TaxID=1434232 RepID=A0A1Y2K0G4_9PROT|nr:hypothetical protein MAIT1_00700 [Magnetofaba australis IT-1]